MGFVGKEHSTCPSYRERENLCVLFYLLVREIERERERRQKDQVIVIRGFGVEQRRSLIVNEF